MGNDLEQAWRAENAEHNFGVEHDALVNAEKELAQAKKQTNDAFAAWNDATSLLSAARVENAKLREALAQDRISYQAEMWRIQKRIGRINDALAAPGEAGLGGPFTDEEMADLHEQSTLKD